MLDVIAPSGWTGARIEAWLDWGSSLPTDLPPAASAESLGLDEAVLAGGPARYASRQACWGSARGLFDDGDAKLFAEELFAILTLGLFAPGAALPDGFRLHPLVADPSTALPPDIQAARTVTSDLTPFQLQRLRAVADAVIRCDGDAAECADPAINQPLARAALAAQRRGTRRRGDRRRHRSGSRRVGESTRWSPALATGWSTWTRRRLRQRRGSARRQPSSSTPPMRAPCCSPRRPPPGHSRSGVSATPPTCGPRRVWRRSSLDIELSIGFSAVSQHAYWRRDFRPIQIGVAGLAERLVAEGLRLRRRGRPAPRRRAASPR